MSSFHLDPLDRAELETLAQQWREVYPAGEPFRIAIMEKLTAHLLAGKVSGDDNGKLFLEICRFANSEISEFNAIVGEDV